MSHASKSPRTSGEWNAVDDTSFSKIMAAVRMGQAVAFRLERSLFFQVDTPHDEHPRLPSILALRHGGWLWFPPRTEVFLPEKVPLRGCGPGPPARSSSSEKTSKRRIRRALRLGSEGRDDRRALSAVPEHVRASERPSPCPISAATPSMMRLLLGGTRSLCRKGSNAPTYLNSAANLLRERPRRGGSRVGAADPHECAKRFVGCPRTGTDPSLKTFLGRASLVAYLRRYFRPSISSSLQGGRLSGKAEKVCWSYPCVDEVTAYTSKESSRRSGAKPHAGSFPKERLAL
jgi:hypothetical protein